MENAATHPLDVKLEVLSGSLPAIWPEVLLSAGMVLLIVLEIAIGKRWRQVVPATGLLLVLGYLALIPFHGFPSHAQPLFLGMAVNDGFGASFRLLTGLAGLLTFLATLSTPRIREESHGMSEFYLMLLPMLVGMGFMAMSTNLLMGFLSIELVSVPSYVLAAYTIRSRKSSEAALKYVIYGGFSAGIMLYGVSWIYGITGTLDLAGLAEGMSQWPVGQLLFALGLVLAGFAFKLTLLPFHFWAPDVYEAVPHPVAAFFSTAPKIAGFALLIRLLEALPVEHPLHNGMVLLLAVLALAGMTFGNLAALRQENVKRMLAYSGIAHSAYILAGALCMTSAGYSATLFYSAIYLVMNFGAFYATGWLSAQIGSERISDFRGLAAGIPVLAVALVIFLVSLTGLPGTAGFIAKFKVLMANWEQSDQPIFLVLMAGIVINTVISLFFYMRIPAVMVFQNPQIKNAPRLHGFPLVFILLMALPILLLGFWGFDALANFFSAQLP
jgi:NADH-quinone oxidoreductase subunit N